MKIFHQHIPTTSSTQTALRQILPYSNSPYTLLSTDYQTAGRGQGTNHWESANGENLLFSLALHPKFLPPFQQFLLSESIALALIDTLGEWIETKIKWPNDIYVEDKKIAGILIECDITGKTLSTACVGIGLNVNQTLFLSDAPNPISLRQIVGHKLDREELLKKICHYIDIRYKELQSPEGPINISHAYNTKLYRKSELHEYLTPMGERFRGKIEKVTPTGTLFIVDEKGKERTFLFKEITYII